MTKVVMISSPIHSVPPTKGAAVEWWMYQVSRRLSQFEPHIIAICNGDELAQESCSGVIIHRIKFGRIYKRLFQKITRIDPFSYGRQAVQIIDQIGADIVHVHNSPKLYLELRARDQRSARKYVLHMHNEKKDHGLPADCDLFVVSKFLERYFRDTLPNANITTIPNGVDTALYVPKWQRTNTATNDEIQGQIPPGKKVVLYAGRMSPEKGPLKLVKAFLALLEQRRDVFLVLAGEFSGREESDRTAYGAAIKSECAKIQDHCVILGDIAPQSMQEVYAIADLVVMPSVFSEPFGMVAIEAMAAGVPVLAARKGGLMEIIEDRVTGIFIRDEDQPRAFANQISEILDDEELIARVQQNARRYVEPRFRWEMVAERIEAAYRSTMDSRPNTRVI